MKKILVIAQFTQLPGENGNNRSRFKYICEKLAMNGFDVTQVTSRFCDLDKSQRKYNSNDFADLPYKIEILEDPGYIKTISIKRIYSQKIFAKNLDKWLKDSEKFDLVYCAGPPAEGMLVAGEYAKKNKIPFVIDIQDLWPEAMKTVINIPIIKDILFYPLKKQMDRAYSLANGIIGVSNTYTERVVAVNKIHSHALSVFIGTDLDKFDEYSEEKYKKLEKDKEEFWITYAGSLNVSYDVETIVKAMRRLSLKGYGNIRLIILGSGAQKNRLSDLIDEYNLKATFTGWVDYGTMVAYLRKSDLLVNAIKKNAAQSITNKIGDYVSANVPIINGSTNQEFIDLVNKWDIGYNYTPENEESMAAVIEKVISDSAKRLEIMGNNARKLAEEKFDRKYTYTKIIELIKDLLND